MQYDSNLDDVIFDQICYITIITQMQMRDPGVRAFHGFKLLLMLTFIIIQVARPVWGAAIQNCQLSYAGVTDQAVSTAYLSFLASSAINKNLLVLKINYGGVYTSSILSILSNNNATCSLKINNAIVGSQVSASTTPGIPVFSCNFAGVNLTAGASVNITLSNVRNPPFKNGYLPYSFGVTTSDNVNQYDSITACTLNDVAVDSYEATFDVTSKTINQNYGDFVIQTKLQVSRYFVTNDEIYIDHPGLQFTSINTSFLFQRSATTKNMTFSVTTGATGTGRVVAGTSSPSNYDNDKIKLIMNEFTIKMPSSASPQQIVFKFNRGGLEYMQIYAWITANPAIFNSTDLKVTPSPNKIGYLSDYTLNIQISQPLGPSARILVDLPQQVLLTQFASSPVCSFVSVNQVQSTVCSINNAAYKLIQVDINSTAGISAPQNITVTINNLLNPDNPEKSYSFGVETYYNQVDVTSKVELGASIFSLQYSYRPMVLQLSSTNYTVNQYPATLTLQYSPGVRILSSTLLVFQFVKANVISVVYKSVTVNATAYTYTQTTNNSLPDVTTITLTASNQIPASSTVEFIFQFRAPASVSYYDAVKADVKSVAGVLYQSKTDYLPIFVANPANEVFSIAALSGMTGVKTNYSFNFFTNVEHPSTFWLCIKFPADTDIDFTKATCSPTTVCKNPISNYSVILKTLYLNITKSVTGNTYSITVTNITNSREMGSTDQFQFQTQTNASNAIISGSASALISLPNTAACAFDMTKQYYKSNTQTVKMSLSLFNGLKTNDTIQLRFDNRTYSLLNGDPTFVKCEDANLNCSVVFYTSSSTVIEVAPQNLTSTPTYSINVQISGLISSATTYPIQEFQITVRSYSADGMQMDEGKLTYNISCRTGAALLNKNCRTCYQNTTNISNSYCQSCYSGYYLYNNQCVTSCASSSTYKAFANSTDCIACVSPCLTCISALQCLSCVPEKPQLYENFTCGKSPCDNKFYLYNDTANNIQRCLSCWSPLCQKCVNGSSTGCIDCGQTFLEDGRCFNSCNATSSYVDNATKKCLPCDSSCSGCTGGANTDCIACRPSKVNVSDVCLDACPQYSVKLSNGSCGCEGNCSTCVDISTRCVTCKNDSHFVYDYQCRQTCPNSSYQSGQTCVNCPQGCLLCTPTTCSMCLDTYYVYENRCYSECNTIGQRFAAVNGKCIQCPQGCDLCDQQLNCTVCLTNYTLVGTTCKLTCELNGNCEKPNPVPDKIIPIPGFITASVWLLIIVVLKFLVVKKLYLPYSFIFLSCLIELILVFVVISKEDAAIKSLLAATSTSRLLQVSNKTIALPQSYQYSVIGLLACSIVLNYVANFIYVGLFCKYLRKYIPDRQIDKISNYLVLVVGTLLNFRFSLLAYSKMFPKPNILVQNQSKLTPIHYMCIASIFTALFPLIAAGILIYNEYPLTDLFMLGVDLLIIVLLQLIFTIWMVSVDKPDDYFEGIKKYAKEEFNQTTEGLNQKQDVNNQSKTKLASRIGLDNSVINIQQINQQDINKEYHKLGKSNHIKSDNQNQPLPNIPIRASNVNLQTMKIIPKEAKNQEASEVDIENSSLEDPKDERKKVSKQDFNDKQTERIGRNKTDIKKNNKKNEKKVEHHEEQKGIQSRNKQAPKNFSKQKRGIKNTKKNDQLKININQSRATNNQSIIKAMEEGESEQLQEEFVDSSDPTLKQANSEIIKREKRVPKTQTQRSSGILPATMKKRESFGVFESEKAESSQIDEIDFETLIQTKMVDKTKDKHRSKTLSHDQDRQIQQISPSWFNQQNQRFDIDENSENP